MITNSTISGNTGATGPSAQGLGGGIASFATMIITNSTISGNLADNAANGSGGGIYNTGTITVTDATVSGNAAVRGGGIYNSGTTNARNTIIARNTASQLGPDFDGFLTSQGFNLIGTTAGTTITGTTTGNQLNVDPLLGPLQDNGGSTFTQGLMFGSPATDKGNSPGYATDQRGFTRPLDNPGIPNAGGGDGSDIGAFEDQNTCENQVVTNNNDSGAGSLRDAIAHTCVNATITFASGVVGPINLTSGELLISTPMTITGPGANLLTVQRSASASTNFGIFHISAGGYVTISGLTVTKGNPNHDGGGIYIDNQSILALKACTVTGNSAAAAGGIPGNGGGIAVAGTGTPGANISTSAILGNSATGSGGGIFVSTGTLDLDNSTIAGNSAVANGGGIVPGGTTRLFNDTIANNTAANGGGVRNGGYSVTVRNTLIARNTVSTADPDFSGALTSQGYNLIGNTAGASITGTTTGNILNVNPLLGPLQDNGGTTPTLALLTGSPAIDQGSSFGVTFVDQRGGSRPFDFPNIPNASGGNGSDIGAFEAATVTPTSAVSRKTQGAGTYDINLPLTESPGIECRSGGVTNDYQIIILFPSAVTFSSAAITSGSGMVASVTGNGTTTATVNLTGVTNAQRMAVTLSNVDTGTAIGDVVVPMAILVGDTNGNGSVNSSDVSQTKLQSGQTVTSSNFREDVNANGTINSSDVSVVKLKSGSALR